MLLFILAAIALLVFLADPVWFIGCAMALVASAAMLALAAVVALATVGACWLVLS